MVARQLFICSAIEKCREIVNCCPHKTPHIKDERCVPRECRYAPGAENIDCDPFDPAHPRAPVKAPVAPAKTVEQEMKEQISVFVDEAVNATDKDFEKIGKMMKETVGEKVVEKAVEFETASFEQEVKEQEKDALLKQKIVDKVKEDIASIPGIELVGEVKVESVPAKESKEQDIKEAVKKASQKPVKAPKKTQGRKKGE